MKDGEGRSVILFHLKRFWEGRDLYEEIRTGRKTSEFREDTPYWRKRLIDFILKLPKNEMIRAWFVCGYPKGNLPRLEATITEILDIEDSKQLEIKFKDVQEAISIHVAFRTDDYHEWKKSIPIDT